MKTKLKSLPRIFIDYSDYPLEDNVSLYLNADHQKHLGTVLRLKPGHLIEVVDTSKQLVFLAEIQNSNPLKILIKELLAPQRSPKHQIVLIMAVCKADKNEMIIEKCTELGVSEFIFIEAKHSIAKLTENKIKRLAKVSESAAEQSKQTKIPSVTFLNKDIFNNLQQIFQQHDQSSRLICALSENTKSVKDVNLANEILIAIGPEGDFSEEEYAFFNHHNFQGINLGTTILRSETAAIASCARILV